MSGDCSFFPLSQIYLHQDSYIFIKINLVLKRKNMLI